MDLLLGQSVDEFCVIELKVIGHLVPLSWSTVHLLDLAWLGLCHTWDVHLWQLLFLPHHLWADLRLLC